MKKMIKNEKMKKKWKKKIITFKPLHAASFLRKGNWSSYVKCHGSSVGSKRELFENFTVLCIVVVFQLLFSCQRIEERS